MSEGGGRTFLNLSGGVLALVLAAVVVVPVLCCAGLMILGMVSGGHR